MANFGILDPNAFQRGFQQGRAPFEEMRARREQQGFANALAALQANPGDTNALAQVTAMDPRLGFQISQDAREAQQAQQEAALTGAAVRGSEGAMDRLASINPELWMRLDKRQQDETERRVKIIGQAALYADTPEKWDQVIGQLSQQYPDLAQYRGQFSPQARAAAIAQAGEMSSLIDQMKTDWRVVPQGGYLQGFDQMGRPIGPVQDSPAPQSAPSAPAGGAQGAFQVVGLPGDQETSGRRSAADNRRVDGVPNSFHLTGQASDRVPPPGMSMAAYAAELQRLNPNLEVINEGDHVHLEPRSRDQFAQGGGVNREQLVAQARDAIAKGADPAAVQARLNQLLGGN